MSKSDIDDLLNELYDSDRLGGLYPEQVKSNLYSAIRDCVPQEAPTPHNHFKRKDLSCHICLRAEGLNKAIDQTLEVLEQLFNEGGMVED